MKTIFILDDEKATLSVYESFLNAKYNHQVITETNYLNALDIIKNNEIH